MCVRTRNLEAFKAAEALMARSRTDMQVVRHTLLRFQTSVRKEAAQGKRPRFSGFETLCAGT